jgi:spoIIIJ-associated protein
MTGFFSKIFGGGKSDVNAPEHINVVNETLKGLVEKSGLDVEFNVTASGENSVAVQISGSDEKMLTDKDGMTLDAIQLFLLRVLQHRFHDEKIDVTVDCSEYRREANRQLEEVADQLREKVLTNNKSVYYRALPPKDRKVIHQYLANDGRVRSRSVGEGLYKRIKVYPVRSQEAES